MTLIFLSDHLIRSSIRCARLRFDRDIPTENRTRQLMADDDGLGTEDFVGFSRRIEEMGQANRIDLFGRRPILLAVAERFRYVHAEPSRSILRLFHQNQEGLPDP
jgi:hypothetical protein